MTETETTVTDMPTPAEPVHEDGVVKQPREVKVDFHVVLNSALRTVSDENARIVGQMAMVREENEQLHRMCDRAEAERDAAISHAHELELRLTAYEDAKGTRKGRSNG